MNEPRPVPPDPDLAAYLDSLLNAKVGDDPEPGSEAVEVSDVTVGTSGSPVAEKLHGKAILPASPTRMSGQKKVSSQEKRGLLPRNCPSWLAERFLVLVFKLAQLRFAVPVCQIRGAWEIEESLVSDSRGDRVLGELELLDEDWLVIDTAKLIFPEKVFSLDYRWVLPTALGTLALACEGIETEQEIQARRVRWRQNRTSRPWLLGMLPGDSPCPLIDVEALVAVLQSDSS